MSWNNKYLLWKKQICLDEISCYRQLFFKTNPTEEQIMLLDLQEKNLEMGFYIGSLLLLILGIVLGFLLYRGINYV